MFKLHDIVKLKEPDTEAGVSVDYLGAIVDVLADSIFTVEFVDGNGEAVVPALYKTYSAEKLQPA